MATYENRRTIIITIIRPSSLISLLIDSSASGLQSSTSLPPFPSLTQSFALQASSRRQRATQQVSRRRTQPQTTSKRTSPRKQRAKRRRNRPRQAPPRSRNPPKRRQRRRRSLQLQKRTKQKKATKRKMSRSQRDRRQMKRRQMTNRPSSLPPPSCVVASHRSTACSQSLLHRTSVRNCNIRPPTFCHVFVLTCMLYQRAVISSGRFV